MINYCFEITVNLFQSLYLVAFLYLFFGGKYSKKANVWFLVLFIGVHFGILMYFTFNNPLITMLDMVMCLIVYMLYGCLCLNGQTAVKIIIPIVMSLIYTIVSYGVIYLTSIVTGLSFESLGAQSSLFRYICVVLVNLTMIAILLIVLQTKVKLYIFKSVSNIIAFICIPMLAMTIIYMTVYILIFTDYQENIIPMLTFICVSMIVIASMVWFMISRINKNNQVKLQLLLTEQRADLYKEDIKNSSRQIEEINKIKHDMKNNIACIDSLVQNGEYDKIHNICKEAMDDLISVGSLIYTENAVLNAVVNVEIEKARINGITVKCKISNNLHLLIDDTDVISIVANLLDNAINYLTKTDVDDKIIKFSIEADGNYSIIKCRNKIKTSVLEKNPSLITDKEDNINHGKGILIIKDIALKYGGDVIFSEKEDCFSAIVILDNLTFPKN